MLHCQPRVSVEFEIPEQRIIALQDSGGFATFLHETASTVTSNGCALWLQVADVDAAFAEWIARSAVFSHPPRKSYWVYGAPLADTDAYLIRLWDERSMKEK